MGKKYSNLITGKALSVTDRSVFHRLSLIAFFAWVGLGADGLSSSCYGPPEAFAELGPYAHLGFFVALGTAITIFVISASYSQIIELFPSGGGGYLVASKLLSPRLGMVSGCALLIDYVLTIAVSIASGADALFSFLPAEWHASKLPVALVGVAVLIILNIRGVKESVIPLVPIFLIFVALHAFTIIYAIISHSWRIPEVGQEVVHDIRASSAQLGTGGMILLVLRAYSMGAGTFTGIEAVSNGLPILREPRVRTARRTMVYMSVSLATVAMGLMVAYILYSLSPDLSGKKTLNALLFEDLSRNWSSLGAQIFVLVTLISEAAILFVAAQAGFLDGPRVIANMALDQWVPTRFAMLSDRLVTQNGVLLMGGAAMIVMAFSHGDVRLLVILYSINVFITIFLSQLGMVRHWWQERRTAPRFRKSLFINGLGMVLSGGILVSIIIVKFDQGGWITLLITLAVVMVALWIRSHYDSVKRQLNRLEGLVTLAETAMLPGVTMEAGAKGQAAPAYDPAAKTAVLLVNGFNGVGLHSLFNLIRFFGNTFRNLVFLEVGVVDAGKFKGVEALLRLRLTTKQELEKYVEFCKRSGYFADYSYGVGVDPTEEVMKLVPHILQRYPGAIFFGGQLVFEKQSRVARWLHNSFVFEVQRRFYTQGIPFMILPIRI